MPDLKKKWLDIASLGLSALCVIHCLALPFLVVLLPALTPFTGSWVHAALVLTAAPISLWAIRASHVWRKWQISAPIITGLILLAAAAFIPALADMEVALSVIGALLIATLDKTIVFLAIPSSATPAFKAIVIVAICLLQSQRVRALFSQRRARTSTPRKEAVSA